MVYQILRMACHHLNKDVSSDQGKPPKLIFRELAFQKTQWLRLNRPVLQFIFLQ